MIQRAKSGAEVLIVEGLATASLVNPEREASSWAQSQHSRLKACEVDEPIVVLGVGSGFHLLALEHKMRERGLNGPLVGVDICIESISFAQDRLPNVQFVIADVSERVTGFVERDDVSSWLMRSFTFLAHKPTISRSNLALRTIEGWILGRTPEAFSAHLHSRPQIAAALNPGRAQKIAETPLLSVRDLSTAWDISAEQKSDRRLFRVLEELVR